MDKAAVRCVFTGRAPLSRGPSSEVFGAHAADIRVNGGRVCGI